MITNKQPNLYFLLMARNISLHRGYSSIFDQTFPDDLGKFKKLSYTTGGGVSVFQVTGDSPIPVPNMSYFVRQISEENCILWSTNCNTTILPRHQGISYPHENEPCFVYAATFNYKYFVLSRKRDRLREALRKIIGHDFLDLEAVVHLSQKSGYVLVESKNPQREYLESKLNEVVAAYNLSITASFSNE